MNIISRLVDTQYLLYTCDTQTDRVRKYKQVLDTNKQSTNPNNNKKRKFIININFDVS